ncbi:inorganic phosphate transporter [Pseudomonas sp. ZM23]|uniref:Phosphate transporter n=2 Tax=Pseudomonas triclosanedens TaxID=2961893 RepID=A0ABY6ZYD9_9PSED|nr:inorganic phosphate transporter [Pseudomonas triclosanedens]MCP8462609.1 inorganic phosphate transporter [Pseudomonas triclosanedens]MCP8468228.1 inorganic phosphate transporter [Pseudomonas triclosanedens]MCP8474987.1 inorganic phosphate transporter [Pseudomonas triclosanedens]WAI49799.1 inorganic phosphate transporter [Pseudomonas triclosanedens]
MLDRYGLLEVMRASRLTQFPISPVLRETHGLKGRLTFFLLLAGALVFTFVSLGHDIRASGTTLQPGWPMAILVVALLVALSFEFINGFHDTANAVATVIYTNALPPRFAVAWSGVWNFLGVLFSSGAVAFAIVALLPLDLLLEVDSSAGLAMIFALLIASILWNLGTWWLGLPVSSSHTLIGSIVGIGLAHGAMAGHLGLSGSAWSQLLTVGYALLLSPVVGFFSAFVLLRAMSASLRNRTLFHAPEGRTPPPWRIRGLLIVTCTGVSFAHGSNDGQKGIGLIMLILIATVPLAFAVDRAHSPEQTRHLLAVPQASHAQLQRTGSLAPGANPQQVLLAYQQDQHAGPDLLPSLGAVVGDIATRLERHGEMARVPSEEVQELRNDLYLSVETIRLLDRSEQNIDLETWSNLQALRSGGEQTIRFIPVWVKVAVALALGLGTLVGWRRIVTTVGEGIGKAPLTYAQGAAAQLVAMLTIGAADGFGLPVSTTHVLSSGVAGTMAANGSGLQWPTIRNMLLAWVLTLPAAIGLAAGLYWLFMKVL